jgi:hypothetical protein
LRSEPTLELEDAAAAAAEAAVAAAVETLLKPKHTPGALEVEAPASKPALRASAVAVGVKPKPGASTGMAAPGATYRSRGLSTSRRPDNLGGWPPAPRRGGSSAAWRPRKQGSRFAGGAGSGATLAAVQAVRAAVGVRGASAPGNNALPPWCWRCGSWPAHAALTLPATTRPRCSEAGGWLPGEGESARHGDRGHRAVAGASMAGPRRPKRRGARRAPWQVE